jgi:hypothetical protein
MAEKKETDAARREREQATDKSHAGSKPGRIGDTDVAPEHDPSLEKSGRREFGRDG